MKLPEGIWQAVQENKVDARAGIYAVRIVTARRKPWLIRRFLDKDADGILCLGQSSNLESRRRQFVNGIRKRVGHSEANLLYILGEHADHRAGFGTDVLASLEWSIEYVDAMASKQREEQLIKAYVKRFGEPPPLNSAIPNRYGTW